MSNMKITVIAGLIGNALAINKLDALRRSGFRQNGALAVKSDDAAIKSVRLFSTQFKYIYLSEVQLFNNGAQIIGNGDKSCEEKALPPFGIKDRLICDNGNITMPQFGRWFVEDCFDNKFTPFDDISIAQATASSANGRQVGVEEDGATTFDLADQIGQYVDCCTEDPQCQFDFDSSSTAMPTCTGDDVNKPLQQLNITLTNAVAAGDLTLQLYNTLDNFTYDQDGDYVADPTDDQIVYRGWEYLQDAWLVGCSDDECTDIVYVHQITSEEVVYAGNPMSFTFVNDDDNTFMVTTDGTTNDGLFEGATEGAVASLNSLESIFSRAVSAVRSVFSTTSILR